MVEALSWKFGSENKHPFCEFILQNKNKRKGWIQDVLPESLKPDDMDKNTCTDYEQHPLFLLVTSMSGVDGNSGPGRRWRGATVRAFGYFDLKSVKKSFGDFVLKRYFVV